MSNPHVSGDAATFWEQHYAEMTKPSGGRPSVILARFADGKLDHSLRFPRMSSGAASPYGQTSGLKPAKLPLD